MSQRITKEELKAPDAFVSITDKVFRWIEHNFALIGLVIGVGLVGALGWLGYTYYDASREQKAADAIYKAEAELKSAETRVRDERAKMMGELGVGKKEKKPEQIRPADYTKDFAPAVEKVKARIRENASTKAALVSALELSSFLMQQRQFAEAMAVLDVPTYKAPTSDVLGGFWLMQRGLTYLENQKVDEAIGSYQDIVSASGLKTFHPEAMLKLGLALEVKGDKTKARETYERLGREFPNTEASTSAQQYLRLLELNQAKQG